MSKQTRRVFSTAVKEVVVLRVAAGERVAAVALELGVQRKLLYEWWRAWEKLGIAGLNRRRGPGLWRASSASLNLSARLASSRLTLIFFAKPCVQHPLRNRQRA